jgi:integrase
MGKSTINIGSIYEYRGKLRLKIRLPNVVDAAGKPKYLVKPTPFADTAQGRKFAKAMLDELYLELYHGKAARHPAQSQQMMGDLLEEFLDYKAREASSIRGIRYSYASIVRGNYAASFERIEQDIYHFVTTTTVSQTSKNTILRQFASLLNWMADEKDIKVPKKILSRYGKRVRTIVKDFTDDEVNAVIALRPTSEFTLMLTVMIETGARPVDVLTLMWDQVDMAKRIVVWKNKISKAPEPRPISKKASEAFSLMRQLSHDEKVFKWRHSSLSRLTRMFASHCTEAGVDSGGKSLKHLRTTFKRRLMEKNIPFEIQMYLMRHSSPDVTLGNYTSISISAVQLHLSEEL